jgi:hypothetical protein
LGKKGEKFQERWDEDEWVWEKKKKVEKKEIAKG